MAAYHIEPSWTSTELDEANITTTFLIENIIAEGQHSVIAGASKTMKTSIGIDAALSLARPCKFLSQFWVPEAQRVLFMSAESGEGTIQETARRIAKSKGFELSDDDRIRWSFWVPKAKNTEQLTILDYDALFSLVGSYLEPMNSCEFSNNTEKDS
jgi:RecA-family ATPase